MPRSPRPTRAPGPELAPADFPGRETLCRFAEDYIREGSRVLEAGIGECSRWSSLAGPTGRVATWPPSPRVGRSSRPEVGTRSGNPARLSFRDESYDVCIASGDFLKTLDLVPALTEIRRILKPGAFLLMSITARSERTPEGITLQELDRLVRPLFNRTLYWGQGIRSPRPFFGLAWHSAFRRLLRLPDLVGIPTDGDLFRRMERRNDWRCERILAVASR